MKRISTLLAMALTLAAHLAHPATQRVSAQSSPFAPSALLYDAALGGTPDSQGLLFATFPFSGASATQSYDGSATLLDTTPLLAEFAGYSGRTEQVPALDRATGYSLFVTMQLLEEQHSSSDRNGDGISDRAGFSLTLLGADVRGIELGFWENEVWAQADDSGDPEDILTHAESAAFDPTAALRSYELRVKDDGYTLLADGAPLLRGPLRDYSSFGGPFGQVYRTPNLIFLGDNSSNGSSRVRLVEVRVATAGHALALPLVER